MQWELNLGAVISARPTLTEGVNGEPVAYVGTHAGRFVGVVVEGPAAGEIVLDLYVNGIIWSSALSDGRGRLYFGADDDILYAVDPAERRVAWSRRLGTCQPARAPGPEGARCDVDGGPTLGPDGELYVGADGLYRVERDGEVQWRFPAISDDTDSEHHGPHVMSTPWVTPQEQVVFGAQDGTVTAVDRQGQLVWRFASKGDIDGSAVAGADGQVFVGSRDDRLYALAPEGRVLWNVELPEDIDSTVAITDRGTLVVGCDDGRLRALR